MQITILGMGQVGSSIGLSLSQYKESIKVVGYDTQIERQNFAKSIGACASTYINLHEALEDADLVVLATPYSALPELFSQISGSLKPGAVVLCTAPNKKATAELFKNHFPADAQFIGLTVSFNPLYTRLLDPGDIIEKTDLFENTTIGISTPTGSNETALKYASDLVRLLGAKVLYLDILEADGVERMATLLPTLASSTTLFTSINQPGWNDSRNTIGQPFSHIGAAYGYEAPQDLAEWLLDESEAATGLLERYIAHLIDLRDMVREADKNALSAHFENIQKNKQIAFEGRKSGNWEVKNEQEKTRADKGFMSRIFFGDRKK